MFFNLVKNAYISSSQIEFDIKEMNSGDLHRCFQWTGKRVLKVK